MRNVKANRSVQTNQNHLAEIALLGIVDEELAREFGRREWSSSGNPMRELINTILSQNTSDRNSMRASQALWQRFPTLASLEAASIEDIATTIAGGGLAQSKARSIKAACDYVAVHGNEQFFDDLVRLPVAAARKQLTAIPGTGPKTASCVLLFSLGMPAMPVDTHVHRVASRLGILPEGVSPADAHEYLESLLENDTRMLYNLHLNMIQHGRRVCHARTPNCDVCVLKEHCNYYRKLRT